MFQAFTGDNTSAAELKPGEVLTSKSGIKTVTIPGIFTMGTNASIYPWGFYMMQSEVTKDYTKVMGNNPGLTNPVGGNARWSK